MKASRLTFLLIFYFTFSVGVFAQIEGNPENWCRNGAFPSESNDFRLAKIKGKKGERVYFYGEENDCPNGKNCRLKSYLIPGDEVIVSRNFGKWSCSWYQPKRGAETVGWLETENLEFSELSQNPETKDWLGEWNYGRESSITIAKSKKSGFFDVKGNSFWNGGGGNVNVGEIEESVSADGNILKIGEKDTEEYACKVTMRLLGRFLVVSDNLNCGGLNVTFSGVYQRK